MSPAFRPIWAPTRLSATNARVLGTATCSPAWASCSATPRHGVGLRQPVCFMPVSHLRSCGGKRKPFAQKRSSLTVNPVRPILKATKPLRSALRPHRLGAFLLPLIHLSFLLCSLPHRSEEHLTNAVFSRYLSPCLRRSNSLRLSLQAFRDALGQSALLQP